MKKSSLIVALALAALCGACDNSEPRPTKPVDRPPPVIGAQPTASASAAAKPDDTDVVRVRVETLGMASFVFDAPREKIKGKLTKFRGNIDLFPKDMKRSRGKVEVDLTDLAATSFADPKQVKSNATQTEQAKAWLEVGPENEVVTREKHRWATFEFTTVEQAEPSKISQAPDKEGGRVIHLTLSGQFKLHGVAVTKQVKLDATFVGPPELPNSVQIKTVEPIRMSLKEHDIKPRDPKGKLVVGALEKLGKKIDDTALLSIDIRGMVYGP
jgi:polyisoprenoid-binding protein YceI